MQDSSQVLTQFRNLLCAHPYQQSSFCCLVFSLPAFAGRFLLRKRHKRIGPPRHSPRIPGACHKCVRIIIPCYLLNCSCFSCACFVCALSYRCLCFSCAFLCVRSCDACRAQVRSALDTSNFEAVNEEDKVLAYTGPQKLFDGF